MRSFLFFTYGKTITVVEKNLGQGVLKTQCSQKTPNLRNAKKIFLVVVNRNDERVSGQKFCRLILKPRGKH